MWGMRVFAWYCNICKTCAYGIWCVKVMLWGHQSTTWTCLHSMRSIQGTVSNWHPRERRLWIIAHHSPPYSNTRTPAIQCYTAIPCLPNVAVILQHCENNWPTWMQVIELRQVTQCTSSNRRCSWSGVPIPSSLMWEAWNLPWSWWTPPSCLQR